MPPLLLFFRIALVLLLAAGLAAWAFVAGGGYDVSATTPHWRPVYELLEVTMQHSVQQRASRQQPPLPERTLHDAELQQLGAACFARHCIACHGAPGVAPEPFALGMQPVPRSLIDIARVRRPEELYWVTRHGIKMSGMPAWEYRLSERELLAVTAFLAQRLPQLSASEYADQNALPPAACGAGEPAGADASHAPATLHTRGELALRQHGCTACHAIPGVAGPDSGVGPSLAGFGRRETIAGRLPNTRENLERWIRDPRSIDPRTAMPALGVSERSAREMADYLAALP